jgi:hypothetical protein
MPSTLCKVAAAPARRQSERDRSRAGEHSTLEQRAPIFSHLVGVGWFTTSAMIADRVVVDACRSTSRTRG